jgi:proton-translocating NADH-quinone oxidoreductase chain N
MEFVALLPEIIVALTALLVIAFDLIIDPAKPAAERSGPLSFATGVGLVAALGALIGLHLGGYQGTSDFYNAFLPDTLSTYFRATLLISGLLTLGLSVDYVRRFIKYPGEFFALLTLATLGAMFLTAATEITTLYLSLELLSLSSFVLVAMRKDRPRSAEASIKYLIFGAISSGILLYGFSLLFGITGSLSLAEIQSYLQQNGTSFVYINQAATDGLSNAVDYGWQSGHLKLELLAAILMVLGGLAYKVAAVPFHMWAPDVYEGAPIPVTAFLSATSKVAGFAALIRIFEMFNTTNTVLIATNMVIIMAVLSMTFGNLVAIAQKNVKRLFAYSSIAHAGYLLMGVMALSDLKVRETALLGLFFYLLVYVFTNLGAFAVMTHFTTMAGSSQLKDWSGLGRRYPWLGFALGCCLLSLTGLPPFAGFTGKFYIFGAVTMMGTGYLWLVLIGVLNSVISLYYYARILRTLFFGDASEALHTEAPHPALTFTTVIAFIAILGLFIFPKWIGEFVSQVSTLL